MRYVYVLRPQFINILFDENAMENLFELDFDY